MVPQGQVRPFRVLGGGGGGGEPCLVSASFQLLLKLQISMLPS